MSDIRFMGLIRTYLALAVVFGHAGVATSDWVPLHARNGLAVQIFYVISGFYMQLIFRKYVPNLNRTEVISFYLARLFRIFPLYYVTLIICIVIVSVFQTKHHWPPIAALTALDGPSQAAYLASNLLIAGQDILRFFAFDPAAGGFRPDFFNEAPSRLQASSFAVLGQAWTLANELVFYALVPLIVPLRTRTVLLVFGGLLLGTVPFFLAGKVTYNVEYGLPLFFLPAFIAGALMCRVAKSEIFVLLAESAWGMRVCFLATAAAIYYGNVSWDNHRTLAAFTLALPFAFVLTRTSVLDRWVGELSYPIYMIHFPIMHLAQGLDLPKPYGPVVAMVSVPLAVLMFLLVQRPIDAWRTRRYVHRPKAAERATNTA